MSGVKVLYKQPPLSQAQSLYLSLAIVGIERVNEADDLPRCVIEVTNGREGVQASGMELVAVLHGQLAKTLKIPLHDAPCHLCHPSWHHRLSPEL